MQTWNLILRESPKLRACRTPLTEQRRLRLKDLLVQKIIRLILDRKSRATRNLGNRTDRGLDEERL